MTQVPRLVTSRDVEATAIMCAGVIAFALYVFQAYAAQFGMLAILYTLIILRLVHNLGSLDVRVLFFAVSAVYSTAGSVDYYFFEDSGGYGEIPNASILLVGSTFMTPAGAYLVARARDCGHAPSPEINPTFMPLFALGAMALLAIHVGLNVNKFGLFSIGEMERTTLTTEQSTVGAVARNLLVAVVLVWTWAVGYLRRRFVWTMLLFVVVLGLVVFELFYFGNRRIILCMLLGIGYLTLNRSRLLPLVVPFIGAGLFGLIVFSPLREMPIDLWFDIVSALDLGHFLTPVNLDSGGFPLLASNLLASSRLFLMDAPNYLDGLLATIPSEIYPGRPVAFSVWYVQTFHPEIAATGGGRASNWIIESYVNMGVIGPVIVGILTAGLLNVLCSPRSSFGRLSCAAAIPTFAFLMRYDLTTFTQLFCLITVAAVVFGRVAGLHFETPPSNFRRTRFAPGEFME